MIRRQQQPQQQPTSQSPQHAQQQAVYRELQMERDRHVIEDKYRNERLVHQQQEREDLHRDERRRMEDYFQRSYTMDTNARMERERIEAGPHAYVNAVRQGGPPRPSVPDDRALTTENLINAIITHNIKSPAEPPMRYVSSKSLETIGKILLIFPDKFKSY